MMPLVKMETLITFVFAITIAGYGCRGGDMTPLQRAISKGAHTKITVRIVDHKGEPVKGAQVKAGFEKMSDHPNVKIGKSDKNGLFTASAISTGEVNYNITKDGYYYSSYTYNFPHKVKNGRWQPWNPTVDILFKPVLNPVPMYAKSVDTRIPLSNEPVGYDLKKGDWVAPHGRGEHADLFFNFSGTYKTYWTGSIELTVSVKGQKTGLQICQQDTESDFVSAYKAPQTGYKKKIRFAIARTKTEWLERKKLPEDKYLVLRTRTEMDRNGNLKSACYTKIYPPLKFDVTELGKEKGTVDFEYFFNPHRTRNLEFDPDNNLFDFPAGSTKDPGSGLGG